MDTKALTIACKNSRTRNDELSRLCVKSFYCIHFIAEMCFHLLYEPVAKTFVLASASGVEVHFNPSWCFVSDAEMIVDINTTNKTLSC